VNSPILEYLLSDDPLSEDALEALIKHKEEDPCLDYKLELNPNSEREWLEITKDVSAFANTFGGYLIFGIRDNDKSVIGLEDDIAHLLSDANNVLQKINRHLDPNIEAIRSKPSTVKGKNIVALQIPQSIGKTHLIAKDGIFKHPSGKTKMLLHKGTFYVRRSAGNHLGD
jgi:predicted HTH transcriptional regulator